MSLDGAYDPDNVFAKVIRGDLQNRELVATQPRQHITFAQRGLQPLCDHLQHGVSCGMAESVVDRFEAVQIQHQDRERTVAVAPRRAVQRQQVEEARPVRHAGEGVVERERSHSRFGAQALALVTHGNDGLQLMPERDLGTKNANRDRRPIRAEQLCFTFLALWQAVELDAGKQRA